MQAVSICRQGMCLGVRLNESKEIVCGDLTVPPQKEKCVFHEGGVVYELYLDNNPGIWVWHTEPELVESTEDQAVVLIDTRDDGMRESWIKDCDPLILKNSPDTSLREGDSWEVGMAIMEPNDSVHFKPEWARSPRSVIWIPQDSGMTIQEVDLQSIHALRDGRQKKA